MRAGKPAPKSVVIALVERAEGDRLPAFPVGRQ
jgi:hypothetical protein